MRSVALAPLWQIYVDIEGLFIRVNSSCRKLTTDSVFLSNLYKSSDLLGELWPLVYWQYLASVTGLLYLFLANQVGKMLSI